VRGKPYRRSPLRRGLNGLVRPLARLGLAGPRIHLLTVPGRRTGKRWSTPVSVIEADGERWLVAPYGERNWVRNARAAGVVELRRGRRRERVALEEVVGEAAVPVLRRYYALGRFTRRAFDVDGDSSLDAWAAEASRHPVFRLRRHGQRGERAPSGSIASQSSRAGANTSAATQPSGPTSTE
jgi:deazaflavin-dependent oxidoreductase (nitroreductase family)